MARPYVAVIGSSEADAVLEALAEGVGEALGRADAVLVCGGGGGVMEAACRGAHSAGGLTVGLLPGHDRGAANAWVGVALPTGIGELRNGLIIRAADAVIAIGGRTGTLSEIAFALRARKPVFGLGPLPLEGPLADEIAPCADPEEAVRRALDAVAG